MGRSVYFVRGAGIYPRLFSERQRGSAGCADGAGCGIFRAARVPDLRCEKGERRTHTEAGARHFAAVAGADTAGTGAERAVRHGDGDHGKRVVRRADRGVQPHGLQRLLGAEPVPVGVSSDRQPLAAEEEF